MTFIIYAAVVVYVVAGAFCASDGFFKARDKKVPTVIWGYTEANLIKSWEEKNRWPNITTTPRITLEKFYQIQRESSLRDATEADALRAQAYRRLFWSPVWPILVVGDVVRDYQKAKAGEKVYLLEQAAKSLEKASAEKDRLDTAYNNATGCTR